MKKCLYPQYYFGLILLGVDVGAGGGEKGSKRLVFECEAVGHRLVVKKRSCNRHKRVMMSCKDVGVMKLTAMKCVGLGLYLFLSSGVCEAEESLVILLERGVALMQDESKLEDALAEFGKILLVEADSKKLAAEARYRMAKCYLKLGKEEEAKAQVAALRKNYDKENKWVEQAALLLPGGPDFIQPTWGEGEFATYDVKIPSGQVVGHFYSGVKASERNGEKTWTGYFTRTAGGFYQSRVEFSNKTMEPFQVHSFMENVGEFHAKFHEDGRWEVEKLPVEGAGEK